MMISVQEEFPIYPPDYLLGSMLALSLAFSKTRSFREDAITWNKRLKPQLIVEGKENIPQKGPFLLVINHYYRAKYKAWWSVLAASALVPVEIHWIMTSAWTFPGNPIGAYLESISRLAFQRVSDAYQFFTMPPMPPRKGETVARALAVRRILNYVKKNPDAAIGLAPEGGDSSTGRLEMPAPGVGRFLIHLAEYGLVVHPLGIYEAGGALHLNFGESLDLHNSEKLPTEESDQWCRQTVLQAIAVLLPCHLRGNFL